MLIAEAFPAHYALRHAFFTREGGVSEGRYASLNCGLGSADQKERVRENRARAMARIGLPAEALVTARQVHSSLAAVVDDDWGEERPQVDALVTRRRGLALGILTADCAPVLFADAEAGVIGAAHAGWKGARGGVLEATLAAMETLGARRAATAAAVGPCIRTASYEVTADFRWAFVGDEAASAAFFAAGRRPERFLFDLAGYVADRLQRIGIAAPVVLPHDTCADADRFFSYRRVTLDGGGDYGRQLSTIALLP